MAVQISVRQAAAFYVVLLGLALIWGGVRGEVNVFVLSPETTWGFRPHLWLRVGIGVGAGLVFVAVAGLLGRLAWARRLNSEFRTMLGGLDLNQVTILAVASSVAEEAFFRGAMQPSLGYIATSVIFGLLHIGPGKAFWPWTLSALAAGFALGAMTMYTGDLLAATLTHFTVNYFNLWRIANPSGA